MFKSIRIAILLTLLVIIAGSQFLTENRLSSWNKPLWVTVFPVLGEADEDVQKYIEGLRKESFEDINEFIRAQAHRYGHQLDSPLIIQVAKPLASLPPVLPVEDSGFNVAVWSLKMRWWIWKNSRQEGLAPADIRMFVVYKKSISTDAQERSVGVRKGSYGIVNAVASPAMAARNRIIISHELLHILGATDKYNLYNGQPVEPIGLASPQQKPLYPQTRAEIMSGRIAISARRWRRPATLDYCVIGATTATEIGWLK